MTITYRPAHADIVFEVFDADLVVLDLRSGSYFGFNASGAAVWNALMQGATPDALVEAGISRGRLDAFLARVVELNLATTAPATEPSGPVSAELAALLAGDEDPSIEEFDDLADLMQADPIHEVDAEFGWPHRPADA